MIKLIPIIAITILISACDNDKSLKEVFENAQKNNLDLKKVLEEEMQKACPSPTSKTIDNLNKYYDC